MKDYYKILELEKGASSDEIKKKYKTLVKKYHPDVSKEPDAEAKFKDIAEAYEILGNPEKKNNYDTYGSNGGNGGFPFNDFFNFGDMFNTSFEQRYRRTKKGTDLRIKLTLTLEDIIKGLSKKIKYKRKVVCTSCTGTGGTDEKTCVGCNGAGNKYKVQNTPFGQMRQEMTCNLCEGKGRVITNKCKKCSGEGVTSKDVEVEVNIPSGLKNGMQLNMSKHGNEVSNGIPGDLLILVEEIKEPNFLREGKNLYTNYNIDIIDLLLGKKDTIKTPYGNLPLNIDPLTNPNYVKLFKGKGIPDIEEGLGDLFVKLNIKMPNKLSSDELNILANLKGKENFK